MRDLWLKRRTWGRSDPLWAASPKSTIFSKQKHDLGHILGRGADIAKMALQGVWESSLSRTCATECSLYRNCAPEPRILGGQVQFQRACENDGVALLCHAGMHFSGTPKSHMPGHAGLLLTHADLEELQVDSPGGARIFSGVVVLKRIPIHDTEFANCVL